MTRLASGPWDVTQFEAGDKLPIVAGTLRDRSSFSARGSLRVLDLPIRFPGTNFRIPDELRQFTEAIQIAAAYELGFGSLDYVYVTVDQKLVEPGVTQRRAGWHSDAFIVDSAGRQLDIVPGNAAYCVGEVERTYVCYDSLPTWFLPGPFRLGAPNDCDAVLDDFNVQAFGLRPITYPAYHVLGLDPYCVHASQPNTTGQPIARTFVKIQFSRHRYNREGNTHNPLFDYAWEMVPRDPTKREHRHL